jgi:hypothetical protein
MPYIDRDQAGNIVGIYANAQRPDHEWVETAELWVAPLPPQVQIDKIERETMMNRAAREALLLLIEREAMREFGVTDLPTVQAGLYAGNPAYRRVKDIDNQIVALRALL